MRPNPPLTFLLALGILISLDGCSSGSDTTVGPKVAAPTISAQPADTTVATGAKATFTVAATGAAPLTYQWTRNGTAIAGATSAAYTTPDAVRGDSGALFAVTVTNAGGSVTSRSAVLTVLPPPPVIGTQPADATVATGAKATFTVAATGAGPLSYQWTRNGTAIAGATSAAYTTPDAVRGDSGALFAVTVTNAGGSVTSRSAVLTVLPPPYPVGVMTDQTIVVNNVTRQYRVHVPAGMTTPKAVVLVLHGGGGEGIDVSNTGSHPLSVFRTVADREGFVVVYPGGLPSNDRERNPGWVDCRADNTIAGTADDVGFLAALVERVRGEYGLTTSRMFMAGGSNGAQMTHAFVFNRADLVAAVATSSGSLPVNPRAGGCTTGPSQPRPIMIVHGSADSVMPWPGGCVADIGGACNRGRVISAEATRDRWLQINGLTGVTPTTAVVDSSSVDAGPANRWDYAGAVPVQWWRLDGAGHTVASRTVLVAPSSTTGVQSRDVEFAEIAWAFFKARLP